VEFILETTTNTRLGQGIGVSRELIPEAIERTISAIEADVASIRRMDVDTVRIVGTSAVRDAVNSKDFIRQLKEAVGIELQPLSGQEEARFSYCAVSRDPQFADFTGQQVVLDVGGGSTEMIQGTGPYMGFIVSVKAGAVRFTEKFLQGDPPTHSQRIDAEVMAERLLGNVARKLEVARCIGVGGSIVNLARVIEQIPIERSKEVHGSILRMADLRATIDRLILMKSDDRKRIIGLEPERSDIIVAGAVIIERAIESFGLDSIIVSGRGIRHAVVFEILG
jgi:exopolyphosphatase/guanosine-5'-triphosphate,3'-diphosphate pyrophosphatase